MPILLGEYEIKGILKNGRVSSVYHGLDNDGRRVVIKVSKEKESEIRIPEQKHRIEILEKLNEKPHTHILPAHDFFLDNGRLVEVIQFLEGYVDLSLDREDKDYRRLASWRNPVGYKKIKSWFIKISDDLSVIHSMGLIHSDLHPSNILVNPRSDDVKIIDFGMTGAPYRIDVALGGGFIKPRNLNEFKEINRSPPEYNWDGSSIGPQMEVFKIGAYFRELNQKVYVGEDEKGRHAITEWYYDVPENTKTLIEKATQKSPKNRHADCGELLKDLMSLQ